MLAETPGVRLFSLQFGTGREHLAQYVDKWPITDLGDKLGDFANTAAIMQNLDLVITSDSAPAHLAGALGLPVWVALRFRARLALDDRAARQPLVSDDAFVPPNDAR